VKFRIGILRLEFAQTFIVETIGTNDMPNLADLGHLGAKAWGPRDRRMNPDSAVGQTSNHQLSTKPEAQGSVGHATKEEI
jgi:hypothetical protein